MNKQQPIITVIIPIYNDELYLRDALLSIQHQIFDDFECICVNDGSVDKSEEIIDEFVLNDSRFVKINRTNGGVSAARNAGLNAAHGEYVFFMDHDDLTPAYTLKKLYDAAIEYNADLARGRMMMIAEDFKLEQLPKENSKNKAYFYTNPLTNYYRYMRGENKRWYYVWMCLFKKTALTNVRFVDALRAGGEDFLFTFDAVANCNNFVQITDVVACHRHSKISVTQNGYKPELFFGICEVVIPYIYQKYAQDSNIDKRLLWWVYHKESYAVYRFLIRNVLKKNNQESLHQANTILTRWIGTAEFKEILKRWNYRQKLFLQLLLNEKYSMAKKFNFLA